MWVSTMSVFFFKQKTAYEMRISDLSSDVCSSDLLDDAFAALAGATHLLISAPPEDAGDVVLQRHEADIAAVETLEWIGYLSTTGRSEERRVGKECVSKCRSRGSPCTLKKKQYAT